MVSHASSQFVEYLVERLAPLGAIHAKKMFGGYGVYFDEIIFAIVVDGALYLKADEHNRAEFEAAGMERFRPFPDKNTTMPYYAIAADIVEHDEALLPWAREAMDAGLRTRSVKNNARDEKRKVKSRGIGR